jgi:MFS family permease
VFGGVQGPGIEAHTHRAFAADITVGELAGLRFGKSRHRGGRKPLFLAGFAILPIRAVLYTLSDNSFWLIGVQLLDGVGAGIFGALAPLVIADIMRGTGRYNLAQGAIATMQGIGASLSGLAAGEIVDHFGYSATFLTLGAAALVAVIVFFLQMPETAEPETESPQVKSVA